jgi:hypothetical protein
MIQTGQLSHPIRNLARQNDPELVRNLSQEFAKWAAYQRRSWSSWQEAWNAWAKSNRMQVRIQAARCEECQGRGWSVKAVTRTSSPVCTSCHGTRRPGLTTAQLTLATLPGPP